MNENQKDSSFDCLTPLIIGAAFGIILTYLVNNWIVGSMVRSGFENKKENYHHAIILQTGTCNLYSCKAFVKTDEKVIAANLPPFVTFIAGETVVCKLGKVHAQCFRP